MISSVVAISHSCQASRFMFPLVEDSIVCDTTSQECAYYRFRSRSSTLVADKQRHRRPRREHMMSTKETAQHEAIRRTALDYIDGWYTGDAERMRRSLHPDLAKRIQRPDADGRLGV